MQCVCGLNCGVICYRKQYDELERLLDERREEAKIETMTVSTCGAHALKDGQASKERPEKRERHPMRHMQPIVDEIITSQITDSQGQAVIVRSSDLGLNGNCMFTHDPVVTQDTSAHDGNRNGGERDRRRRVRASPVFTENDLLC